MAIQNPAFTRNAAFAAPGSAQAAALAQSENLERTFNLPSATPSDTDRMTIEDTITKTTLTFVVLLVTAAVGWMIFPVAPLVILGAAIVGLVLGLVNSFKKEPSPPLIFAYAAAEGLFLGGISALFEQQFNGIVIQAVLATVAVFAVTLVLFKSGKIRVSARANKVFLIAMVGYLVFSLLNMVLSMTGVLTNPWGMRGALIAGIPLGLILGVLVVIMAAYSLVIDFDFIQRGVENRANRKYGWSAAFGIMITVVWLYLELLRMFAIARD